MSLTFKHILKTFNIGGLRYLGNSSIIALFTSIIGTIVDNSEAESYRYVCSNGSSTFVAYGQDTTYKNGDSV